MFSAYGDMLDYEVNQQDVLRRWFFGYHTYDAKEHRNIEANRLGRKFESKDIGQTFVRISPVHYGLNLDLSLFPESFHPTECRKASVKLIGLSEEKIVFQDEGLMVKCFTVEKWNDGNWIELSKILQIFKENI